MVDLWNSGFWFRDNPSFPLMLLYKEKKHRIYRLDWKYKEDDFELVDTPQSYVTTSPFFEGLFLCSSQT